LTVPELATLIPSDLTQKLASSLLLPTTLPPDPLLFTPSISTPTPPQKEILKTIFASLMNASEESVKIAIDTLLNRYDGEENIAESEKGLVELVKTLNGQYPGDVGVLCVFILNVVELKVGEAAFLGADMPHAYIKGGEWQEVFFLV
jgi:mannose-6-phosphate isomerase